jgi:uncharacterized protein (DUF111 family)
MKKNRPGVLLTLLSPADSVDRLAEMMLTETTAFGVRATPADRRKLRREFRRVDTPFGEVMVKVGILDGRTVQASPEYESCKVVAEKAKVALRQVYEAAVRGLG